MSNITVPIIRRRADGSIDFDHYDRIARRQRARDQRAALERLAASARSPLGVLWRWLFGPGSLIRSSWWQHLCRARFSAHSRR